MHQSSLSLSFVEGKRLMRKSIIGYFDVCTGCRICELACSFEKLGVYNPRRSMITVKTRFDGLGTQPVVCIQCEKPMCASSCPTGAIRRDEKTGIVGILSERCTGCGWCVRSCPVEGAIKIDAITGKAIKCDTCMGRPKCVEYCPTQALVLK